MGQPTQAAKSLISIPQRLTGNPLGVPGADVNMVTAPTDVGHYAPVTKAAGVAGAAYGSGLLGGGAAGTAAAGATGTGAGATGGASGAAATGALPALSTAATVLSAGAGLMSAENTRKALANMPTGATAADTAVEKPTAMPTFGSQDTQTVLKNALVEQAKRRGRASTILTSESLGA